MKKKEIILEVHRVETEEKFGLKDVLEVLGCVFCLFVMLCSFYIIFYPLG